MSRYDDKRELEGLPREELVAAQVFRKLNPQPVPLSTEEIVGVALRRIQNREFP